MALRPEPVDVLPRRVQVGDVLAAGDAAVDDGAGEERRLGADQLLAERRADAVGGNHDVGADAAAIEQDDGGGRVVLLDRDHLTAQSQRPGRRPPPPRRVVSFVTHRSTKDNHNR